MNKETLFYKMWNLNKKKLPSATNVYVEATGVEPSYRELWYGKYVDEKQESSGSQAPSDDS